MNRLEYKGDKVPLIVWCNAWKEWLSILSTYSIGWALTYIMGIGVALTSRPMKVHPQGKPLNSFHSVKYYSEGSSGSWEYWNSPYKIFKPWNNYEDGTLGEPSGKHSARVKGKERSFISQYLWTIRNPFNYAKRSIPLFHCKVNDCDIEYWGDFEISDKEDGQGGWQFCKATDRNTGKVYYWYRSVKSAGNNQVRVAAIGFKVKPAHALILQDKDDEDKAFTIRLPVKTNID